jgi:serine/threonine protein kinase
VVLQREFGLFSLIEIVGKGSAGLVFRARDTALKRIVAVKVLRTDRINDPAFCEQLEKEAELAATLHHPNVVRVYSCGMAHERYFVAMEMIEGGSLETRTKAFGGLLP